MNNFFKIIHSLRQSIEGFEFVFILLFSLMLGHEVMSKDTNDQTNNSFNCASKCASNQHRTNLCCLFDVDCAYDRTKVICHSLIHMNLLNGMQLSGLSMLRPSSLLNKRWQALFFYLFFIKTTEHPCTAKESLA